MNWSLFGISFRQRGFSPLYSQGSPVKRRLWSPLSNAWNQIKTSLRALREQRWRSHIWPDGSSRQLSFEHAGKPSYGHGYLVLPTDAHPHFPPSKITDRQFNIASKPVRTATDKALDHQLRAVRKQRRLAAPKKKKV